MPKATSRPSHGSDVHGSRVRVGCLDFDSHSLDEAARYIIDLGHQRQPSIVVTPNTDILRLCTQDVSLRQIVDRAALVLPDGWPVVLASKLSAPTTLLGGSLSSRVPGSDLMWQVCAAADEHQLPVAIVGGGPDTAQKAASRLRERFPSLLITSHEIGPVSSRRSAAIAACAQALIASDARVVLVGMGFPKQELLAEELQRAGVQACFIGIGAGVDFAAGTKPRAPQLMRELGLEWTHRLVIEPKRLWRRYLIHDLPFALKLLARSASNRVRTLPSRTSRSKAS